MTLPDLATVRHPGSCASASQAISAWAPRELAHGAGESSPVPGAFNTPDAHARKHGRNHDDKGHHHMLMFADMLSDGIIKQFLAKFQK